MGVILGFSSCNRWLSLLREIREGLPGPGQGGGGGAEGAQQEVSERGVHSDTLTPVDLLWSPLPLCQGLTKFVSAAILGIEKLFFSKVSDELYK